MLDPIESKVRQIAADVLDLPPEQITRQTSPQTVANWDSVQQLNLVLALEEAMGLQLEPEEIEQIRNVGMAIDLMRKKSAGR